MEIVKVILFITATVTGIEAMVKPQTQGHKYELELQKVLPMNDTEFVVFEGLKAKRYNRTCEYNQKNYPKAII